MIPKLLLTSIAIALLSVAPLPATKSDYDRSYDFSKLRTWDFKVTTRMPGRTGFSSDVLYGNQREV